MIFKEKVGLGLTSGIRARLRMSSKVGSVIKRVECPVLGLYASIRLMFPFSWYLIFKEKYGLSLTSCIRARLRMSSKVGPIVKRVNVIPIFIESV